MGAIRFLTAGESHGKGLIGILEGIPAGLSLSKDDIDFELRRRQGGYGRGGRMQIEEDHIDIISGVRWGKTIGSPIALFLENKDFKNWKEAMSIEPSDVGSIDAVTKPRPGHADLAGLIKYAHEDVRNILERSSARETAMRVAVGAITKKFLGIFDIKIGSYVLQIGSHKMNLKSSNLRGRQLIRLFHEAERSPVRCPDKRLTSAIISLIDKTKGEGDSLGGIFEVFVIGLPIGLGSHIQWDRRIDGRLAQAIMSIQAIKGVEIGGGFEIGSRFGSEVMDEIFYSKSLGNVLTGGFFRRTNNAGGIEGGITNGMPIILRAVMKPIPTLRRRLRSIDIKTKKPVKAIYERSDICAVPAASIIAEAMVSIIIADAFLDKFGGDSISETRLNYESYLKYLSSI
jgi:chorismate synthase